MRIILSNEDEDRQTRLFEICEPYFTDEVGENGVILRDDTPEDIKRYWQEEREYLDKIKDKLSQWVE